MTHDQTFISLERAFEYVGDHSRYQQHTVLYLATHWFIYSCLTMNLPLIFTQTSILTELGKSHKETPLCLASFFAGSLLAGITFPIYI